MCGESWVNLGPMQNNIHSWHKYFITADWLAQLVEHCTAVREVMGSTLRVFK